jgi:hypothetical protein
MKRLFFLGIVPLLAFAFQSPVSAAVTMSQSVVGSGGELIRNGSHVIQGTVSQPVIGVVTGSHVVQIGFWQQIGLVPADVEEGNNGLRNRFGLDLSFVNPFRPGTTISYVLPERAHVTLTLYDVAGREVRNLVNDERGPGSFRAPLDGSRLPSGVYTCRMSADGVVTTKRLILLR